MSFAVLTSLIYLALQTTQTASNQQAAIDQARTDSLNTVVLTLSQPEVQDVFWKGMTTPDDLTLSELREFTGLLAATFSNAENSFLRQ